MGVEQVKGVDYNYVYSIKANNVIYKTYTKDTVDIYEAILDKFNIKYKTTYDKDSQLETTNVE